MERKLGRVRGSTGCRGTTEAGRGRAESERGQRPRIVVGDRSGDGRCRQKEKPGWVSGWEWRPLPREVTLGPGSLGRGGCLPGGMGLGGAPSCGNGGGVKGPSAGGGDVTTGFAGFCCRELRGFAG